MPNFSEHVEAMFGAPGGAGGGVPNIFQMFASGGQPPNGQQGPAMGLNPLMELLLGGGAGDLDPLLVEQLFAAAGHQGMDAGAHTAQQQRSKGTPPASASTLRTLPRVKVSAYDIAANESPECSVCLDSLVIGEPALRIHCGHLYHEDCVKDWLKKSNECPVCRWELPTDDPEYECGRLQRMAGRKIRFRRTDLNVKTAQELRRLANFIAVDVTGCLEKSELVDKIVQSPQVQIIAAEDFEGSCSPSSPSGGAGRAMFSRDQLEAMSISDIKALMERIGISGISCSEKAEMLQKLIAAGLVQNVPEVRLPESLDVEMTTEIQSEVQDAEQAGTAQAEPPLATRSVGQLRQLARELNVCLDGCLEKADIVQCIAQSPAFKGH